MTDTRVKLVGVAKDESAYLAEWCAHHLYFGFDQITVYLNRTTDNSYDILSRLRELDSRINVTSCDWVDWLPGNMPRAMQTIVYSQALSEAREQGFSHVALLDIDEFWMPLDSGVDITKFIDDLPAAHVIHLPWANLLEAWDKPFARISRYNECARAGLGKSIISVDAPIAKMRVHHPTLRDSEETPDACQDKIMPDGRRLQPPHPGVKRVQRIPQNPPSEGYNCYLFHRMYRSEMEYISGLAKGRIENGQPQQLATNRYGYQVKPLGTFSVELNPAFYESYQSFVDNIMNDETINQLLSEGQQLIERRYALALQLLEENSETIPSEIARVTKGCRDETVTAIRHKAMAAGDQQAHA